MHPSVYSFFAALCLIAQAQIAAADTVTSIDIGAQPTWFRQVMPQAVPGGRAILTVNAQAGTRVTVYCNGQRLAKARAFDKTTGWDVSTLLRKNRNSIAIAVTPQKAGTVAAFLNVAGKTLKAGWKHTTAAPPVGWQQTDFNDRDWKPAPTTPAEIAVATDLLQWQSPSGKRLNEEGTFDFRDNDHVLLLGGTFVERAQRFGHLESELLLNSTAQNMTFRNLGWSADTVFAESRGIFDSPERGYERMIEHVRSEEPSVVIMCYGQNEAMQSAGQPDALNTFRQRYEKLIDDVQASGAEVVLITPHPFFMSSERWNPILATFATTVSEIAADRKLHCVDLWADFSDQLFDLPMMPGLEGHPDLIRAQMGRLTDNGMHWNDVGYRKVARIVAQRLFGQQAKPAVLMSGRSVSLEPEGSALGVLKSPSRTVVSFRTLPGQVGPPTLKISVAADSLQVEWNGVSVTAKEDAGNPGVYEFESVFHPLAVEELRKLVVRKNAQYFHRWRPQNITYLYGFRKHEQGNNAAEIAMFAPKIAALESQIEVARSATRSHEIVIRER